MAINQLTRYGRGGQVLPSAGASIGLATDYQPGGGAGVGWNSGGRRKQVPPYGPGVVPPALREAHGLGAAPSGWFHAHAGPILLVAALAGGVLVLHHLHKKGVLQ